MLWLLLLLFGVALLAVVDVAGGVGVVGCHCVLVWFVVCCVLCVLQFVAYCV